MDSTELLDELRSLLPGVTPEPVVAADQKTIGIPSSSIVEVCRVLRDRRGFVFLADVTAVDWWPHEPRFEVVYHLASADDRVRVKVRVPGTAAHLPTVKGVWPAANWLEREVWDLFGIIFDGHDELRRLLMPDEWEGHPLRKDYPVQIRLKPRSTEALQVSEEEFRRNLAADKAARFGGPGGAGS